MFNEILADLKFGREYLKLSEAFNNTESLKETKEAIDKAITLVKLLKDRIEIAESKINNAPLPEARSWSDIKNEYTALYHLERLYNNNEDISNL